MNYNAKIRVNYFSNEDMWRIEIIFHVFKIKRENIEE